MEGKARGRIGGYIVRKYYELIWPLLDEYGITGCRRMDYLHFALHVRRVILRYAKGELEGPLEILVNGLIAYYTTAYELKEDLCRDIADRVLEYIKGGGGTIGS